MSLRAKLLVIALTLSLFMPIFYAMPSAKAQSFDFNAPNSGWLNQIIIPSFSNTYSATMAGGTYYIYKQGCTTPYTFTPSPTHSMTTSTRITQDHKLYGYSASGSPPTFTEHIYSISSTNCSISLTLESSSSYSGTISLTSYLGYIYREDVNAWYSNYFYYSSGTAGSNFHKGIIHKPTSIITLQNTNNYLITAMLLDNYYVVNNNIYDLNGNAVVTTSESLSLGWVKAESKYYLVTNNTSNDYKTTSKFYYIFTPPNSLVSQGSLDTTIDMNIYIWYYNNTYYRVGDFLYTKSPAGHIFVIDMYTKNIRVYHNDANLKADFPCLGVVNANWKPCIPLNQDDTVELYNYKGDILASGTSLMRLIKVPESDTFVRIGKFLVRVQDSIPALFYTTTTSHNIVVSGSDTTRHIYYLSTKVKNWGQDAYVSGGLLPSGNTLAMHLRSQCDTVFIYQSQRDVKQITTYTYLACGDGSTKTFTIPINMGIVYGKFYILNVQQQSNTQANIVLIMPDSLQIKYRVCSNTCTPWSSTITLTKDVPYTVNDSTTSEFVKYLQIQVDNTISTYNWYLSRDESNTDYFNKFINTIKATNAMLSTTLFGTTEHGAKIMLIVLIMLIFGTSVVGALHITYTLLVLGLALTAGVYNIALINDPLSMVLIVTAIGIAIWNRFKA